MHAHLYPHNDQDEYHSPREIACRLAETMPIVLIDWARGKEDVERQLQELIAMDAPDIILDSHRSLVDQTVYIEVSFPEYPGKKVHFLAQPQCRINLESSIPDEKDFIRYAANRLSSALGYSFSVKTA